MALVSRKFTDLKDTLYRTCWCAFCPHSNTFGVNTCSSVNFKYLGNFVFFLYKGRKKTRSFYPSSIVEDLAQKLKSPNLITILTNLAQVSSYKVCCSFVRPILEFASPVWAALPAFLVPLVEGVEKYALRIIFPDCSYESPLLNCGLPTLLARRDEACRRFISNTKEFGSLAHLLPQPTNVTQGYGLRSGFSRSELCIVRTARLRNFVTYSCEFPAVAIGGEGIRVVSDAKLLGLTISSDLTWNAHITEKIKKAAKRLYFLIQLKRARVSKNDLCLFYVTCVRSVIDYAAPVFHYSLPAYLMQELESIQKRAMRIICAGIEYQYALVLVNLPTVTKHHNDICRRTFESICNDSGSKLKKLLPPLHKCKYKLRHTHTFNEPRCKTNRAKNSFIMASCSLANRF
ncbi:hypothetical protein P5673_032341 [Acropora cervicornis]|uniref:Alkylated DNA repair protein AlkB homologue 8 N-terminal domain-containing protein n=1 Tax=Acropora cervicornis TaxID=6130 RepID=A0AAD9PRG1_ACRCE|nr:hypothetical protein P5673_032341 [Acropora cervicornis]